VRDDGAIRLLVVDRRDKTQRLLADVVAALQDWLDACEAETISVEVGGRQATVARRLRAAGTTREAR
jgi:MFS superfamily sulfate permease-like transporter